MSATHETGRFYNESPDAALDAKDHSAQIETLTPNSSDTANEQYGGNTNQIIKTGRGALGAFETLRQKKTGHDETEIPLHRLEEIRDRRAYTGEATGFEREVRLLGREYAHNGPPVIVTEPLGGGFVGYMEDHLVEVCPQLQRPVLAIGNVGFSNKQRYSRSDLKKFHMSWMATDFLSIIDKVEHKTASQESSEEWPHIDFQKFDYIGASQGGMAGLELAAQAPHYSREMRRAALIAPAGLADAYGIKPEQLSNIWEIARQFGWEEPRALFQRLSDEKDDDRKRTIERSLPAVPMQWNTLAPVVATAKEILKGQMRGIGRSLASQDNETEFHILTFEKDGVSTPALWEKELEGLDVRITYSEGDSGGRHIPSIITKNTDRFVVNALAKSKTRYTA